MGALAGIWYDDGRPVDMAVVESLSARNRERGPERTGLHREAGFAMLGFTRRIDPLSDTSVQPLRLPDGSVLTWDGRLDNRDDWSLRLRGETPPSAPDIVLVGAALAKYGLDIVRSLIGDWTLAWWVPSHETLHLASDFFGNRPLHYVRKPHGFCWSTCLETLVEQFGDHDALSDAYFAGVLSFGVPPFVTPFDQYFLLPPGHVLSVGRGMSPTVRRYWHFEPSRIRYARLDDYADRYRELLTASTAARLRSSSPVAAELSGGYDSSSIVCIGDWLVKRGTVQAPRLTAVSTVIPEAPEADESEYIAAVEAHCGLRSIRSSLETREPGGAPTWRLLPLSSGSASLERMEAAQQAGAQVLLSGELGDLVSGKGSSNSISLLEHLQARRVGQFFHEVYRWSVRRRTPIHNVLGQLLKGLVPPAMQARSTAQLILRSAAEAHKSGATDVASAFMLDPSLVKRTNPEPRNFAKELARWPVSKRPMVAGLLHWQTTSLATTPDSFPHVLMAYPFIDRPLLEFVLGIPQSVLWNPDESRPLVKRALAGILPPMVLTRNSKGYSPPAMSRLLAPLALQLLERDAPLQLAERGYVNEQAVREKLRALVHGTQSGGGTMPLLITLEFWFRGRANGTRPDVESPLVSLSP